MAKDVYTHIHMQVLHYQMPSAIWHGDLIPNTAKAKLWSYTHNCIMNNESPLQVCARDWHMHRLCCAWRNTPHTGSCIRHDTCKILRHDECVMIWYIPFPQLYPQQRFTLPLENRGVQNPNRHLNNWPDHSIEGGSGQWKIGSVNFLHQNLIQFGCRALTK